VSPGVRLAAFGVALGATFGAGAALGTAVGPWEDGDPPAHPDADGPGDGTSGPDAHAGHDTTTTDAVPPAGPITGAPDGD
jgi:hypothetical protein